jgi:hypothetical protein
MASSSTEKDAEQAQPKDSDAAAENDPEQSQSNPQQSAEGDTPEEETVPIIKLYKSPRLKGYLTIVLASIINYNAAILSDNPISSSSVPASKTQQGYAQGVALVSAIISALLLVVHLDRYTPLQKFWSKGFGPKGVVEYYLDLFLLGWWLIATIVQTSVKGIAGDGKEQYNLYYSTWVCFMTSVWTLERKMVDYAGWPTLKSFVTSWPYRAPGWIAILVCCFFTLFWYVDLYVNTAQNKDNIPIQLLPNYEGIPNAQYQWLLFVAAFTLLPCSGFIFVEIFRESQDQIKGNLETILEGFCLFLLCVGWIPSVIVATTPGGFAAAIGNAYFWTWLTTVFVMETFLWFIHDFRGTVHAALQEKEKEYRHHQLKILEQTRELQERHEQEEEDNSLPPPSFRLHHHDEENEDEDDQSSEDEILMLGKNALRESPTAAAAGGGKGGSNALHENGGGLSAEEELRLKQTNSEEYYDNLEDILE